MGDAVYGDYSLSRVRKRSIRPGADLPALWVSDEPRDPIWRDTLSLG